MTDQHVNPAEGVRIFDDVAAQRAVGIHLGTVQLTGEARKAPRNGLNAAFATTGLAPDRLVAGVPGGVYDAVASR
jgi:hypothetical protein